MFCLDCGCDLIESSEPIIEEYKGERFSIDGIAHLLCPQCGEYVLDSAGSKALSSALVSKYAELQGLLTPEEIAKIRGDLKLTQEDFQRAIGVTGVTVSRWETGKAQQSKVADNLLRGIRDYPCFAQNLMERAEVGSYRVVARGECK